MVLFVSRKTPTNIGKIKKITKRHRCAFRTLLLILATSVTACGPKSSKSTYEYQDPSGGKEVTLWTGGEQSDESFKSIGVEFSNSSIIIDEPRKMATFKVTISENGASRTKTFRGAIEANLTAVLRDTESESQETDAATLTCLKVGDKSPCKEAAVDLVFSKKEGSVNRHYNKQLLLLPTIAATGGQAKTPSPVSPTPTRTPKVLYTQNIAQNIETAPAALTSKSFAESLRDEDGFESAELEPAPSPFPQEGSFVTRSLPQDVYQLMQQNEASAENTPPLVISKPLKSKPPAANKKVTTASESPGRASAANRANNTVQTPKPLSITTTVPTSKIFVGINEIDLNLSGGGSALNVWNGPRLLPNAANHEGGGAQFIRINTGQIRNGGTLLPKFGQGFVRNSDSDRKAYGTGFLIDLIQDVSALFARTYPQCGDLQIGNLSKKFGGVLMFDEPINGKDRHAGHQNGLEFDLRYFLSPECNFFFLHLLAQLKFNTDTPIIDSVFTSHVELKAITQAAKKIRANEGQELSQNDYEALSLIYPQGFHPGHMHIRVRCSPEHIGCWQDTKMLREYSRIKIPNTST